MSKLMDRLPISIFIGIAGIILGIAVRNGLPKTIEELAIYLSVAVM